MLQRKQLVAENDKYGFRLLVTGHYTRLLNGQESQQVIFLWHTFHDQSRTVANTDRQKQSETLAYTLENLRPAFACSLVSSHYST